LVACTRSLSRPESDARFCRIGEALFDLYGAAGRDPAELEESNARIAGWWIAERVFRRNSPGPSFLCITPVTDRSFSKVHVLIRSDEVPIGSGISFPKGDSHDRGEQLARIFSKELYFREKLLLLSPCSHGQEFPALDVSFSPRDDPVEFPGASFVNVHFSRRMRAPSRWRYGIFLTDGIKESFPATLAIVRSLSKAHVMKTKPCETVPVKPLRLSGIGMKRLQIEVR